MTTHRPYSESQLDFERLRRFALEHNAFLRSHSTWCLGRLVDWRYMYYEPKLPIERFCEANAELWFDHAGGLAGFAICENGGPDFALITSPAHRCLFEEMLSWALQAWGERGPHGSVEITAAQEIEAQVLERCGFRRTDVFRTQVFDLTQPLPPRRALEPGFTIVDMATTPDYRAQRILRDEAFDGRRDVPDDLLERELRWPAYHSGPTYDPSTDLCIAAPNGTYAAGCEAILYAELGEAEIERVCTHSAYRRRGLAAAVIVECLHRLKAMGFHTARITGYSPGAMALYASLGAQESTENWVFENGEGEGGIVDG